VRGAVEGLLWAAGAAALNIAHLVKDKRRMESFVVSAHHDGDSRLAMISDLFCILNALAKDSFRSTNLLKNSIAFQYFKKNFAQLSSLKTKHKISIVSPQ
jgi:hypothetical protein